MKTVLSSTESRQKSDHAKGDPYDVETTVLNAPVHLLSVLDWFPTTLQCGQRVNIGTHPLKSRGLRTVKGCVAEDKPFQFSGPKCPDGTSAVILLHMLCGGSKPLLERGLVMWESPLCAVITINK